MKLFWLMIFIGTVQVLDARHWELFLHEEYINGEWKFEEIEEQVVCPSPHTSAMAAILDAKHVRSRSTKGKYLNSDFILIPLTL